MTDLISLVITVYNRERYLSKAIESVLNQTHSDFELLVWDDGSTDNSVALAQSYAQFDKRVKVIVAPHSGRGKALYDAINNTTGMYLGWVDSDDLLAPTALEEAVIVLSSQPSVGMIYTDYLVIDSEGVVKGLGKRCQIPYSADRLLLDFMTFHFRLIRREVYEQVGGVDASFVAAQDYDLCLRLSEVTEIQHINKPLYLYRNHRENISHTKQFEQIHFSYHAITQALQRRGLANHYELEVIVQPRFVLQQKKPM